MKPETSDATAGKKFRSFAGGLLRLLAFLLALCLSYVAMALVVNVVEESLRQAVILLFGYPQSTFLPTHMGTQVCNRCIFTNGEFSNQKIMSILIGIPLFAAVVTLFWRKGPNAFQFLVCFYALFTAGSVVFMIINMFASIHDSNEIYYTSGRLGLVYMLACAIGAARWGKSFSARLTHLLKGRPKEPA